MSPKYALNKEDLLGILKALGYSAASAIIASLILIIPNLEIPSEYVWVIPIVNVLLVTAKKYFSGN